MELGMGRTVLITGGARSGKSRLALERALSVPGEKVFVATAQATDREMAARIEAHRLERGPEWAVVEEPVDIVSHLRAHRQAGRIILLDCLTIWVANIMARNLETRAYFENILTELKQKRTGTTLLVTNEVGMGIVPDNELARRFRDEAGFLNQRIATVADEVILTVAGIPLPLKAATRT